MSLPSSTRNNATTPQKCSNNNNNNNKNKYHWLVLDSGGLSTISCVWGKKSFLTNNQPTGSAKAFFTKNRTTRIIIFRAALVPQKKRRRRRRTSHRVGGRLCFKKFLPSMTWHEMNVGDRHVASSGASIRKKSSRPLFWNSSSAKVPPPSQKLHFIRR
jgi:hypothetical protein